MQRSGHAARLRRRTGQQVGPPTPVVMLVLGDVGQMGEIRKRAYDRIGLITGQFFQQPVQIGAGLGIGFTTKSHGRLPNRFNDLEDGFTLLVPDDIPEQTPEQPDIFLQWCILVSGPCSTCGCFFGWHGQRAVSVGGSVGRGRYAC